LGKDYQQQKTGQSIRALSQQREIPRTKREIMIQLTCRASGKSAVQHQHYDKEKTMSDKKLSQQKKQAQLDEWKAEIDKLKARVSGASAEVQLKLKEQIRNLEEKVEEGKARLAEIAGAKEDAWESMKDKIESGWQSLKAGVSDTIAKFKK
jgi:chromosome segregation ATPase